MKLECRGQVDNAMRPLYQQSVPYLKHTTATRSRIRQKQDRIAKRMVSNVQRRIVATRMDRDAPVQKTVDDSTHTADLAVLNLTYPWFVTDIPVVRGLAPADVRDVASHGTAIKVERRLVACCGVQAVVMRKSSRRGHRRSQRETWHALRESTEMRVADCPYQQRSGFAWRARAVSLAVARFGDCCASTWTSFHINMTSQ